MSSHVLPQTPSMITPMEVDCEERRCSIARENDEATSFYPGQFMKNEDEQLETLVSENGFVDTTGKKEDRVKELTAISEPETIENNTENTELANTLLSLGGKHLNSEKREHSKDLNTNNDRDSHKLCNETVHSCNNTSIRSSAIPFTYGGTWAGNPAILGLPFTYDTSSQSHCSCRDASRPWSFPSSKMTSLPSIDAQTLQQNASFYFHQQPLVFASNAFHSSMSNYSPGEKLKHISSIVQQRQQQLHPQNLHLQHLHDYQQQKSQQQQQAERQIMQQQLQHEQQQQHMQQQQINSCKSQPQQERHQQQLSHFPMEPRPSLLPRNAFRMNGELPAQLQKTENQSLALIAPMILEFNQNNQIQGIPLIYNFNQWLNMPSCDFALNPVGNLHDNLIMKREDVAYRSAAQEHDVKGGFIQTLTASSSLQNRDPIMQLGEAANMILQSSKNVSDKRPQLETAAANASGNVLQSKDSCSRRRTSKALVNRTCPYCHRIFARPFTLKSHLRRHTKEKPYTCQVCQRSFSQSATLENHKLTHTGVKPHQCSVCLKRFAHQTSLKTHMRIHSGEQPYECSYCARRFTDGSTLQKHKRIHNGDRPFRCIFCDKRFSQSGNMRRHMVTTHKTEMSAKQASTNNAV